MNLIDDVTRNMLASDQTVEGFNVRQSALYMGLQIEELAEKLYAILPDYNLVADLEQLATWFKQGQFDHAVAAADPVKMLDADIDLVVVSLGAAKSQGADVGLAWSKVDRANSSKINPATGKMTKDANGKWIKPAGWQAPDLSDCVDSAVV